MARPALAGAALALLALAGCAADDGPDAPAPPSADAAGGVAPAADDARPARDTALVSIEGFEEPVALRLVRYPDLPAPFSTYLPADWRDETVASGEGAGARFVTGEPPFEAVLAVAFPTGGADAAEAQARAVLDGASDVREPEAPEPWVTFARVFVRDGAYGSVRVGRHGGTAFVVSETVPFDMADGFYPRAALVLDRLRWLDTGEGL